MSSDEHFRKLERMYATAPINAFFAPRLSIREGAAEISIAVRPDFFHAAHAVHGSVYFKALDDAAFFAVNSLVTDVFVLTVPYNVYFTRPVTEGVMTAKGRVVSRSKNLFVAEADLVDDRGRSVGRGSGSFMRSAIPLNSEVGYA